MEPMEFPRHWRRGKGDETQLEARKKMWKTAARREQLLTECLASVEVIQALTSTCSKQKTFIKKYCWIQNLLCFPVDANIFYFFHFLAGLRQRTCCNKHETQHRNVVWFLTFVLSLSLSPPLNVGCCLRNCSETKADLGKPAAGAHLLWFICFLVEWAEFVRGLCYCTPLMLVSLPLQEC